MANIIAIVWDFDKTLLDGYMESPILEEYQINEQEFWKEVNQLPRKYRDEQNVKVNPETVYLNQMIKYVQQGKFPGLNNAKLRSYGEKLCFYDGVPEIFQKTKTLIEENHLYSKYDIKLEHYIVSTGITEIIRGSTVREYVSGIWGCEFIEEVSPDGDSVINEIGYTIDNTTKTRALFEINKGVGMQDGVEVNTTLPEEHRRVHFQNMIYIADGPSDIPAFSLVNRNGGATFAIYPHGNMEAMKQVEQLRKDGRINMFAEANYSNDTTASMWICNKITEFADRIVGEEREKLQKFTTGGTPKHLV